MSLETVSSVTEKYGFQNLLFLLLMYIFGSPFLTPYPSLAFLAHFSLSITLLFSVYIVQKERRHRTMAIIFLLPVLILYWLGHYELLMVTKYGSYSLLAIYYLLLIISSVNRIRRVKRINLNVICGTLCLYLIIGLFWGALYSLLYEIDPANFSGTLIDPDHTNLNVVFNYFSMVTLTTLGYGDITPQTVGAGSLCQMEAIIGQFFTAVLVAWFVGNYVAERRAVVDQDTE